MRIKHNFKKRSKYNSKKTEYNGVRYDSIKEARYAQELDLRVKAGEVVFFLRQVPFHLPGNVRHVIDFVEFHTDGTVHIVEVKGYDTPQGKMKRKMVESVYPFEIELV